MPEGTLIWWCWTPAATTFSPALSDPLRKQLPGKPVVMESVAAKGFTDPTTGMEFVTVLGGCFQMGDNFGDGFNNEKPVHEACVSDFAIGKYEVTQGEYKRIMGNNPSNFSTCGDNCPVENVSWNDTQDFLQKLNDQGGLTSLTSLTSLKYRMPTEAEWEYAAWSGGKREKYSGGNNVFTLIFLVTRLRVQVSRARTQSVQSLRSHAERGNEI